MTSRHLLAGFTAALALVALSCQRDGGPTAAPSAAVSSGAAASIAADARIVSVGGTVTEIVYALGLGPRVVAVDTSSVFPAEASALPQVGYQRTLAAEGVASQRPTLLLLTLEAGPPPAASRATEPPCSPCSTISTSPPSTPTWWPCSTKADSTPSDPLPTCSTRPR